MPQSKADAARECALSVCGNGPTLSRLRTRLNDRPNSRSVQASRLVSSRIILFASGIAPFSVAAAAAKRLLPAERSELIFSLLLAQWPTGTSLKLSFLSFYPLRDTIPSFAPKRPVFEPNCASSIAFVGSPQFEKLDDWPFISLESSVNSE